MLQIHPNARTTPVTRARYPAHGRRPRQAGPDAAEAQSDGLSVMKSKIVDTIRDAAAFVRVANLRARLAATPRGPAAIDSQARRRSCDSAAEATRR